jgi:hypothetical protein
VARVQQNDLCLGGDRPGALLLTGEHALLCRPRWLPCSALPPSQGRCERTRGCYTALQEAARRRAPPPRPANTPRDAHLAPPAGANTSGKSTLLRAACLAAICAQVGAYVPAASALLAPADGIFTRMGAHDRQMLGQSTFAVEMAEASLAVALATPSSLLALDELGRCGDGGERGGGQGLLAGWSEPGTRCSLGWC